MNPINNLNQIKNIVDLLEYRATQKPQAIAYNYLVDGETETVSLTYGELQSRVKAIAAILQSYCAPKERVILLYQPGLDYIVAFYACLYANLIAIPAYPPRPNRSVARIQTIIQDAQPKIALTSQGILTGLEKRAAQTPELQTISWLATDNLSYQNNSWRSPVIDSEDLAFLQYTSGSTADPKGVMVSHQNLICNIRLMCQYFEYQESTIGVNWLPPYHDMGLIGGILVPLYAGFGVNLMSPLLFLQSPLRWLQAISRYRATASGGPNFAYDLCVRKIKPEQLEGIDLSSWQIAFNGAEPINYQTLEQFADKFTPYGFNAKVFYPCYGLAEATLMVTGGLKSAPVVTRAVQTEALKQNRVELANSDTSSKTLVGCGQSVAKHRVIIVAPDKLKLCPEKQVGEIWVAGASVTQGYWNQPQLSVETFIAQIEGIEGTWLRTGDLGFLLDGELFVTGRIKEVIIINGRNYYPQDIERTIESQIEAIRPNCSASFGVTVGEEERLVIVAEVERRYWDYQRRASQNGSGAKSQQEQLIKAIRRLVVQEHDLQVYEVLLLKPGSIPKTSSGKIQRRVCRAKYIEGSFAATKKQLTF